MQINLEILNYSLNHIHTMVLSDANMQWLLIKIYGQFKRWETWNLMKSLLFGEDVSWLIFSYYNELVNNDEKWGVELDQKSNGAILGSNRSL